MVTTAKRQRISSQSCDRDLLSALLDVSGLLVVVLDDDGAIRLFNHACERLTGYRARDMLGQPIWNRLIPAEELDQVRDIHGRLWRGEASNTCSNHWLTRGGEKRLIQWHNASLLDEAGHLCGVVGTGIDMTEQEQALRSRGQWEAERHHLLDALPMLIAYIGLDFRVRFANDGYRHWFGLAPKQVLGRHVASVIGDVAFKTLQPHFREALKGNRASYHGNVDYLHGPGRFIHGTYIPAFDDEQRVNGFYIVAVDLSEQQRLREELAQEKEKARQEAQAHLLELSHATRVAALSEVAAGLAHEISQPLTAIAASAEACLMRLSSNPADAAVLQPALERIAHQSQRARQIIEQLRGFLRKEQEDTRVDCNPGELIRNVLLLLDSSLESAGIEVKLELDDILDPVSANPVQIEQVLFNLVRNAIEVLEQVDSTHRRIRIRCRNDAGSGRCHIEVSDTGPGLRESEIARLFHPFYTTKREGLGQGLSICRSIVDRHGGQLVAANETAGGAVFRFSLPLARIQHD